MSLVELHLGTFAGIPCFSSFAHEEEPPHQPRPLDSRWMDGGEKTGEALEKRIKCLFPIVMKGSGAFAFGL